MRAYEETLNFLSTLKLKGIANSLDELVHDAQIQKVSYITFINTLFSAEVSYRVKRRVQRNMAGAHFPIIKRMANFEFGRIKGMGKSFGVAAVQRGYSVCFEKITNLIKLLKTAEIQKKSAYRIKKVMKSNLVVIDEIGYTPIEKREANLFFNLISEMYERLSIVITSNKSFESWAEMMGDSVMTTALLDRLLHHARIFNLDGESYRIKNQRKEA